MAISLKSIDPVQVAEEVCGIVGRGADAGWQVVAGTPLDLQKVSIDGPLGRDALAVARYAQSGPPVAGFEGARDDLLKALVRVVTALHVPLASRHQLEDLDAVLETLGGNTGRLAIPLDDEVNVALAGAWVRLLLERNEPITAPQLALAGGVSEDRVRAAIRSGQLPTLTGVRPAVIAASSARVWLSAREVAGFSPATKIVEVEAGWVGLVYAVWHSEWGRVTRIYPTREQVEDALARAAAPDPSDTPHRWDADPEKMGWRIPIRRGRLGDEVALS